MRLLILGPNTAAQGPLPKVSASLTRALQRAGCFVRPARWGSSKQNETLVSRIPRSFGDVICVIRMLLADRYDALLLNTAHDWKTLMRDIPLLLAVRCVSRTPIVVWLHGSQADRLSPPRNRCFRWASSILVRLASVVSVLSKEELVRWQALNARGSYRLVRYPMPLEVATEPSGSAGTQSSIPQLLFVGRLIPDKGVMEAIDAMPSILEKHRCRLLIVGDGPLRLLAGERVRELGIEHEVVFKGYLSGEDLLTVYSSAAAFLLPTVHAEGFPVVILEALRAGIPIITTRIRGAADWLVDRRNVLFLPHPTAEGVADSVIDFLSKPTLADAMRLENKKLARQFDPDLVADDWLALFKEAIEVAES